MKNESSIQYKSLLEAGKPPISFSPCYVQPGCQLYNEDCLKTMQGIETGSVDLILQDPPYNTTACEWEYAIDFETLWKEWVRIGKENCTYIFTTAQPFTTDVVMSNRKMFKYETIWMKSNVTGFLSAAKKPLRQHENILLFCNGNETYNPQMFMKATSRAAQKTVNANGVYGNIGEGIFRVAKDEEGFPRSVINFNTAYHERNAGLHPTQKGLALFRYLVKTYSNEDDLVFDGYSGSATTAAACIKEKRRFIGSELSKEYFDKSVKRLELLRSQPELF